MSHILATDEHREEARRGWSLPHVLVFPAVGLGMWMIYHPWPVDTGLCQAGWILATGYAILSLSSCFHETTHQTYSGSPLVSIWVGRTIGTLLLIPYTVYRETHIRHHAYLNTAADWELWPYSDPRASRWFRRLFVWFDLFVGAVATPVIYGRIFFHRDSPLKSRQLRRTIWLEYLAIVVFWSGLILTLDHFHALRTKNAQWVLALLVMTFLQTGRKLTEHLGMASYDPIQGTRTVLGAGPITRLTTYLQFDIFIHGPHHRYPRMPHIYLKAALQPYLDGSTTTAPVFRSYAHAVIDMLPWLWRNPGVGENVGALPRTIAKSDSNFDFTAPAEADLPEHDSSRFRRAA